MQVNAKSRPDYPLLILVAFFLGFGLLMILSASIAIAYRNNDGDTFFFLKRQVLWILAGGGLGFVFYQIPVEKLKKIGLWIIIGSIVMMIYMLPEALSPFLSSGEKAIQMPLVSTRNGATRWISLDFFDIQPAELLKLGIILFISSWFTISDKAKKEIEKGINKYKDNEFIYLILSWGFKLFPFLLLGIISVLILLQNDLDTLAIIFLIFLSVFYVSRKEKSEIYKVIGIAAVALIAGFIAISTVSYRNSRLQCYEEILIYGEPIGDSKIGDCFQVWNGLIGVGSGGLFGVGYGQSRQKLFFLQEAAYTDSIFTVVAEEFGLVGSVAVILGFVVFLSQGLRIAKNAPSRYASFVAVGITSWITIQAFLNIAANLALIPFGGMPLPFLTYGGSNTIMILAGVGILLNISKKRIP